MSDNELALPENMPLVPYSAEDIAAMSVSSDYLKRLQLIGANSDVAKEGKIQMGVYALVTDKENMKNLGASIDVLVCSMRFKAMQLLDGEVQNVYDQKDPEFTRIREASANPDSGCLCGLDFLLWLPTEKAFVTFFMASKSARREAPTLLAKIKDNKPGPATLGVKLASNKKYKWHVSTISNCTTAFELPTEEDLIDVLDKFRNPKKDGIETVKDKTERAR